MAEKGRVCVTGAGGYLGSWVVKLLLSRGYIVHGTVREPGDEKNSHLKKLEHAAQDLHLFKADLLDYQSLCAAIAGCKGVFHVASPVPSGTVPNPEVELIEPAVTGTHNVLKACSAEKVHKVIVVSSVSAVSMNPNWPKNQVMDEMCWSDKEYCRETKNFYCLSKTLAESQALEYAKNNGLNIVTVCPSLILGPILQPTMNASSLILIKLLKEGYESLENKVHVIVDVRDVAEALLLAYEKPEAEGRYICASHTIRAKDLIEKLRSMYPNYNYPKNFKEVMAEENYSSEKLQKLGWKYRSLEESLSDSVRSYQEAGILDKN
ncbi:PREDICTED: cinnamoyl-CoA reductase 1-like [Nelumbo nucifera]|uniref:Cinnamoyl-CoA reductase 1-like n=1 Tax=Nelumbo nucifera TaxID=4432 RepID=A0A1U8APM3_NELNU|nr:PREDICTED: cinnamoyl-CoA reductase 1-like [Nelumbo nucifera]XP_019054804.1 PREDICTED: cinnamoyl-CoA reductase 1-like [Nelumbo nucifera]